MKEEIEPLDRCEELKNEERLIAAIYHSAQAKFEIWAPKRLPPAASALPPHAHAHDAL